jgi:hypothetical protein
VKSLRTTASTWANPDPRQARDPEQRRDPDDALIKLTTAADVAQATAAPDKQPHKEGHCPPGQDTYQPHREGAAITQCDVLDLVHETKFVTRWTKLNAIKAIAALEVPDRWRRIWQFARDPDYAVRQAASMALERDACNAYCAIETDIEKLILRAAALSALDQNLEKPTGDKSKTQPDGRAYDIGQWSLDDVLGLSALGTVLPAIVSGLQEDPAAARALASWQGRDGSDGDGQRSVGSGADANMSPELRIPYARRARDALDHLAALTFQGDHHMLERMVAQGFRADAMRHATGDGQAGRPLDRSRAGPGWVAAHERLVATIGLCQAEHWYAQLVLGQALALYTIAGGSRQVGYEILASCLHRGGPYGHAFTQQALRLARTAVRRHSVHSKRWQAFIWDDETSGSNKRPVSLTNRTAQLLGDVNVTILLDLSESAQDDRQEASVHMDELPYCLHRSRDRSEIIGTGCPPECGWNLCPYKQPPPDEPNEHHGVSRAFCRQQRWIARHHSPPWQRRISGRHLAAFWQEMERRART